MIPRRDLRGAREELRWVRYIQPLPTVQMFTQFTIHLLRTNKIIPHLAFVSIPTQFILVKAVELVEFN